MTLSVLCCGKGNILMKLPVTVTQEDLLDLIPRGKGKAAVQYPELCKCEKPYIVVLRATKVAHRRRTSRTDKFALLDCNDCMKRKRIVIVIHLHIAMVFFDRSAYAF